MQFRDLKTQYTVLKDEMDKAILGVVASSAYVMGPKIKEMVHTLPLSSMTCGMRSRTSLL